MARDTDEYTPSEQELDAMIAKAIAAAEKGESIEQLLEAMLASVPTSSRESVRKKFSQVLARKGLRQPASDAPIASRTMMIRIRDVFAVTARQALTRIAALLKSRPDIADVVSQAGKVLAGSGVLLVKGEVTEADLGTMSPPNVTKAATRETEGRGA